MTLVFTLCSNNYLAQAITLGNSLLSSNPDFIFKIGLIDKKESSINYTLIPFQIIEVESLKIEKWERMILRYNIQELNTAVKPFYFQHFMDFEINYKNIIYLDPDIKVYSSFFELLNELKNNDIVITPHFRSEINDDKLPSENDILNTGLYNLGFIAVRVSEISRKMISWWSKRLEDKAYNDVKYGMFTDQIWINFVPLFFEKVKILNNPGYNVGYWNLHERKISIKEDIYFINDFYNLVFYHFSGFSLNRPNQISKYQNRFIFEERPDITPLFVDYVNLLKRNKYHYFQSFKCYYSGIKERHDDDLVLSCVKRIPLYKRLIKKIINKVITKFDIKLDYSDFYERGNLERE